MTQLLMNLSCCHLVLGHCGPKAERPVNVNMIILY